MESTDLILLLLAFAIVAAGSLVAFTLLRGRTVSGARSDEIVERLVESQATLSGRLDQMATGAAASQAELRRALDERLADVTKRVGDTLGEQGRNHQTMLEGLKERLAVIDSAQKNIAELSGQVVGLQEILSNKQARGAFGEVQLENLVSSMLPPSAYKLQVQVGDNRRADCLIVLPNPPGPIAVDAKFPLEGYRALRNAEGDAARTQAGRSFSASVLKHVTDIAERYIVPGETADSALMFIPSEAVYAELHANFPDVVDKSYRKRVYMVSPTTLMATLNTVRAILRDARMREQAHIIQQEVVKMLDDVARLDDRVGNLERHFDQAGRDIEQIRTSASKITGRGTRITQIELGDDPDEAPAATLVSSETEALPDKKSADAA